MHPSTRSVFVLLLAAAASTAEAAVPRTPLTAAEARQAEATARACTGGYYQIRDPDKPTVRRSAVDHLPALPAPGDDGSAWDSNRAEDLWHLATAMLTPTLKFTEGSATHSVYFDCPSDPVSGVRLLRFLAGDGALSTLGVANVHYWLAEAYRAGTGVPADPAKARRQFLIARLKGFSQFGPSAWGERPGETLADRYLHSRDRALFEELAADGLSDAQLLIADAIIATDPKRARALLEAAAADSSEATERLAEHETNGTFGKRNPARAVELLASGACRGCAEYDAMLAAARAHNGGGEIPTFPRRIGIGELGGMKKLLPDPTVIERDSLIGTVEARGLMAPDGRILYVELPGGRSQTDSLGRGTLTLFRRDRLPRLTPHLVDGKPVFAWVNLPLITWGWDYEKAAPLINPEAAPR